MLAPQNDVVTHRLAPHHKEAAAAIETVRASSFWQPAVKLAFEFLALTAGRPAEVRLATWGEAGRVWAISALRMKAKQEHRRSALRACARRRLRPRVPDA